MTQYARNSIIWSVAAGLVAAAEPFEKYVLRCQCASCSAFKKQGEKCTNPNCRKSKR